MNQAPPFSLTAVATDRVVGIPHSLPQTLVLLFQDQNTADATRDINQQIRSVYQDSEDLIVASIVDLSAVPRFMYGMARTMLNKAYNAAARNIPAGYDPADYIMLLPDWTGQTTKAYEVGDVSKRALMVIVDFEGKIALRKQGGNLGRAALDVLDTLI